MKIATAIEKMTDFYKGNIHDIYHFLKVWAFAKNIGEAEGLDPKTQETLEMAAVVHDIACPLCREWITRSCWKPIFWSMPARANIQNRRLKISAEKYFGRKRERIC